MAWKQSPVRPLFAPVPPSYDQHASDAPGSALGIRSFTARRNLRIEKVTAGTGSFVAEGCLGDRLSDIRTKTAATPMHLGGRRRALDRPAYDAAARMAWKRSRVRSS